MVRDEFYRPGHDYRDKGAPNDPEDQFMGWINVGGKGMANAPGIRPLWPFSRKLFKNLPAFLVLLTKKSSTGGSYNPWDDIIDLKNGTVLYWGDAKLDREKPNKRMAEFPGNRVLEDVWAAWNSRNREELPPILHFVKNESGWVTFTGLCVLTSLRPEHFEEKGRLVENYHCRLRILGSDPVPVEWLHSRREARTLAEAQRGAPAMWTAWVRGSNPTPPVVLDAEPLEDPSAADAASPSGQGFSTDSKTRKAVELHAMKRARAYFQERGFTRIEDVSNRMPFDFHASDGTREIFIEVKGTQSAGSSVLLTHGEVEFARSHKGRMVLYVLHSIQMSEEQGDPQGGVQTVFWPWDVDVDGGTLVPIQYRYVLP